MVFTFEKLEDMESELDQARDQYLRERGWNWRCDHPGAIWLWHKVFNGREYMVDQHTALFLERESEELPFDDDDER